MYKMAENTVERMKEQLQCSICLSIYSEPKQLQCNHIFCLKCLESLNVRGLFRAITCPTCRQTTTLPVTGMAELQSAFHIQSLLEVIKLGEQVTPNVAVRVEKPRPRKRRLYCPSHNDRVAELYCETCKQLICYKCTSKRGTHINHEYKEVDELCEGYMTEMKEGVAVLKKLCGEVSTQQAAFVAKIYEKSEQLHEDIDRVKTQMLSELSKMADEKIATLKSQIQDAETVQVQYSGGIEISSPFTQNPADVLSKRVAIVKQMKQTVDTFRAENMKPDNGADMMFLSPEDSSVKLGQVLQCYATGEGLKKFSNGNDITIHCLTATGQPYTDKISLECMLVSESCLHRTTPITPEPYPVTWISLPTLGFSGGLGGVLSKPNPPSNIGVGGLFGGLSSNHPSALGGLGLGMTLCSSGPVNQPTTCGFTMAANRPNPPVGSKALGQPVLSCGVTSPPGVKCNGMMLGSSGPVNQPTTCGFTMAANRPKPPVSSMPALFGSKALGQPVSSGGVTSPPGVKGNGMMLGSSGPVKQPCGFTMAANRPNPPVSSGVCQPLFALGQPVSSGVVTSPPGNGMMLGSSGSVKQPTTCGFTMAANRPNPPVSSGVCQPLFALGQPVSSGGVTSPPGVKDNGKFRSSQGKFRIPYRPTGNVGWHQLHITVCGQHIRGSPFRVEL